MTALTSDITDLLTAALAKPQCDTTRGALMDAMQERDCWTRETILPWALKWKDNDAPRLLFAQWCDGNGEGERGEFIRVQCEIARIGSKMAPMYSKELEDGLDELRPLRWREWELFQHRGIEWLHELPGTSQKDVRDSHHPEGYMSGSLYGTGRLEDIGRVDQNFRRGFAEYWVLSAADWLSHADVLTREHPIERLRITSYDDFDSVAFAFGLFAERNIVRSRRWPSIAIELPVGAGGPRHGEPFPLLRDT